MAYDPLTYEQISRQVMVIFTERAIKERSFAVLVEELKKILGNGVKYEIIAREEIIRLAAVEVVPPHTAADVVGILAESHEARRFVQSSEQNQPLHPAAAANDPRYFEQWALPRMGAEAAWAHALTVIDAGATGIPVAILDTGIHTSHPDLSSHLWDDGSGHNGVNVLTFSNDVFDADGHGTLLAGTVGAISNNLIGIAAAQWPLRLMAVKFHDLQNPPSALNAALAIAWALAPTRRASIIVAAWGIPIPLLVLEVAIQVASVLGVLFVAAAGNDGLDNDVLPTFPACYDVDNVVSVMASDLDDEKPGFSNYGLRTVHLAAPGVEILSTDTSVDAGTARYKAYSGTSAACAHVAYAAALLKTMNPGWSPIEMREHLIASVDPNPWLHCQARGRLSLDRAACGPFVIALPATGTRWQVGSRATVTWTNRYDTPRAQHVRVQLSRDGGPYTTLDTGPNSGSRSVTVPNPPTVRARIRLQSETSPGLFAESELFTIE